jgi:hypothetical protein
MATVRKISKLLVIICFFQPALSWADTKAESSAFGIFDTVIERLRFSASDTSRIEKQIKDGCEKLQQTDFKDLFNRSFKKFSEFLEQQDQTTEQKTNLQKNRQTLKYFLEELGRKQYGESGKSLNEQVGELIIRLRPDLEDTDFSANPAKTIYYYLALDPRGFVENVRIIRGPMGVPMTLRQAYEYYTQSDPEKAAKILILLETLQKIGAPGSEDNQLETILKAVKTNLELINDQR